MNYTKLQGIAYKLWQAGFTPYLVEDGNWIMFRTYPRRSNGPQGGPRWPYIVVGEVDRPPYYFKTDEELHAKYPPVGIPTGDKEEK